MTDPMAARLAPTPLERTRTLLILHSLRQALLDRLRPDHQSVDDLFSDLDLTDAADLTTFLTLQHRGFSALRAAASDAPGCRVTANLTSICDSMAQDLAWLDAAPTLGPHPVGTGLHPLAIE